MGNILKMIVKHCDDRMVYFVNKVPHRANGPAVILDSGDNWCWKLFGEFHRYYGECEPFTKFWFIHDVRIK